MPILKTVARTAFRRGTKGGNRQLVMLSVLLSAAQWARDRAKQPPKVVHREVLEPGEAIRITVIDPETER